MVLPPEWTSLVGDWVGTNAFRLMPDDDYVTSQATLVLERAPGDGALIARYTWEHEGAPHRGLLVLTVNDDGAAHAVWLDSFHQQPEWLPLAGEMLDGGVVQLAGTYAQTWGWRISLDPTDGVPEIVMDNVPPGVEPYPVVHLLADRR